jgi:tetratricopeptide (TPR) repeat protein
VLHALAPVVADTDLDAGGRLLHRAVEIQRARLRPDDPERAETLGSLGGYYARRAEYDRAKEAYRQALAVFPTPQARRHPAAITILNDFAALLGSLNQHAEAEATQREAIEVGRQVLGADTTVVANLVNNLGVTQSNRGRHQEAERTYAAAYQTHRLLLGERHWRSVNVARNIGRSLALQQRYAEALPWMDRAISYAEPGVGAVVMRAQRALILHRLGRRETTAEIASAIETLERLSSPETARRLAWAHLLLGRILSESGRAGEAEPMLVTALRGFEHLAPANPQRAEAACELARARLTQQPREEDRQRLRECLPVYRSWGLAEPQVVASLERLLRNPS